MDLYGYTGSLDHIFATLQFYGSEVDSGPIENCEVGCVRMAGCSMASAALWTPDHFHWSSHEALDGLRLGWAQYYAESSEVG